ncbi:MAG: carboxypeptidase M32 [Clostridia bacterium]|nr:carboxypeptidase M32 [Clostridia bacterium]
MEFEKALELFNETKRVAMAYRHAFGVMSFDNETAAPKNSAAGLAKTFEVLSELDYKLTVNENYFEAIDVLTANKDKLDPITRREVEEAADGLEQIRKIPMEEYTAYSGLLMEAHTAWVEAKLSDDFKTFEPYLKKIIAYHKRVAELCDPSMDAYNYWLNQYEKGLNTDTLDAFFKKVREALVPLIKKIVAKGDVFRTDFLDQKCPIELQKMLSNYTMEVMHINRNDCSIGETEHPFTTHFNKHDVRITTHYHEDSVVSNMYSVIHEGGHALYELNTGDDLMGTTLAAGTSMSIHESQSRFYENIIGRSEAFCELIFPKIKELFPIQFDGVNAHDFYLAVNKTQPSLIRTEADEVTYSLHIMIRYELEKKLMRGEIETEQLPAEWNRLYKEYLGIDVPNNRQGVLQDMHWSGGMIGYFPSYALGSAYGAQILHHMKKDLDVDMLVRDNRIDMITAWLTERIYRYGKLLRPAEALRSACGEDFDPDYYINYLTEKMTTIYGL